MIIKRYWVWWEKRMRKFSKISFFFCFFFLGVFLFTYLLNYTLCYQTGNDTFCSSLCYISVSCDQWICESYQRGLEYTDCILYRGIRTPPPQKRDTSCPLQNRVWHDLKINLHPVMRLQFWNYSVCNTTPLPLLLVPLWPGVMLVTVRGLIKD